MNFNQNGNGYNRGFGNDGYSQNNQTNGNAYYDRGVQNQYMSPIRNTGITGRIIQNPNEVMPNEVPMNGTCSFFPMYDGSAIYVKCWSPDGSSIITQRFVSDGQNGNVPKTPEQIIMDRLDNLERLIKTQNKPYQKFKKGGNVNERNDAVDDNHADEEQPERRKQPQK